jgi:hypothetical protein
MNDLAASCRGYTFDGNPLEGSTVVDVCNKIYAGTSVAQTIPIPGERGYYQADVTDALINARTY